MANIALDVYGTLIDTHGVVNTLHTIVGDRAQDFSQAWRNKQLEYSFRRGLMRQYQPFSICTHEALLHTASSYNITLDQTEQQTLMQCYQALPAFADATPALQYLLQQEHRLYAFSNGTEAAVNEVLTNAGIRNLLHGVVSVDDVQSFKPDPQVYQHFLEVTNGEAHDTWLLSSNAFDILGADAVGFNTVWVKRTNNAVFDTWNTQPTHSLSSLSELKKLFC